MTKLTHLGKRGEARMVDVSDKAATERIAVAEPKDAAKDPDFAVQGPRVHGIPGLVHLFGIESPGLTASLALAGMVLDELH